MMKVFGTTKDGRKVHLYTLRNPNGMEDVLTNYGAILIKLFVPDKNGKRRDVVLGYDTLAEYEVNDCFFGATIGRNANRISNASFFMDGVVYKLDANENGNNLHSHFYQGFHKVVWNAEILESENAVRFSYVSPDGENGFPGELQLSVTYTLREDNALEITSEGFCDKKTIFNVTNHSYFNLAGHGAGCICGEKLKINAGSFTEIKEGALPTGRVLPVEGTPMDFRSGKRIGDEIDDDWEQLKFTGGYDHNWVVDIEPRKTSEIARVVDEKAGLAMTVYSDLPGVQFYAGNSIRPQIGKGGAHYEPRCALCLETQYFPDSINIPDFQQPIIEAGQRYQTTTVYKFD